MTTAIGPYSDWAYAVAIQRDRKILVGGESTAGTSSNTGIDFAIARYNVDGSLDGSFGVGGKVFIPITPYHDQLYGLAVQPDGKILAVGRAYNPSTGYDVALVRLTATGNLDPTFGNNGKVITSLGARAIEIGYAIAIQPDGKLVVAGSCLDYALDPANGIGTVALFRYQPNGTLDMTFGGAGYILHRLAPGTKPRARSVLVLPDGRILAAGSVEAADRTVKTFLISRYSPSGAIDSSFNRGLGYSTFTFANGYTAADDVALLPDGRVVSAGQSAGYFAVAAQLGDPLDLGPDQFIFPFIQGASPGTVQTSSAVTVRGLSTSVTVPIVVSGGTYSVNGGAFRSDSGWVRNGDSVVLRHAASSAGGGVSSTLVSVGGFSPPNNAAQVLGEQMIGVFSSSTM